MPGNRASGFPKKIQEIPADGRVAEVSFIYVASWYVILDSRLVEGSPPFNLMGVLGSRLAPRVLNALSGTDSPGQREQ